MFTVNGLATAEMLITAKINESNFFISGHPFIRGGVTLTQIFITPESGVLLSCRAKRRPGFVLTRKQHERTNTRTNTVIAQALTINFGITYNTEMKENIVLDTNVLVAALKSSRGTSFQLLSMVEHDRFVLHVSTPLVIEYEAVLKRGMTTLSPEEINDVIDFLCSKAVLNKIFYLWRPALKDPDDDFVLELAVKSNATIVTWNVADFKHAARFGVAVTTPRDFLASLEKQS